MADHTLESLERGLSVAELVARRRHVTLLEVIEELGVSKATAYRTLATLEGRDWVRRDPVQGGYGVGPLLMHLLGTSPADRLRAAADEPLRELAGLANETVNLGIRMGNHLVYEQVIESTQSLRMHVELGSVAEFHSTGLGRAFLSAVSAKRAAQLLGEGPFARLTERTITDRTEILATIDLARERGYALEHGESEDGACCIAAAIIDETGDPIGAISLSGPVTRVLGELGAHLPEEVRRTAAHVSRRFIEAAA